MGKENRTFESTILPGRDGQNDWTFERLPATFPRLAERLGHQGALLSGGDQQMMSIGRALMTHPALIILDEATEGLAPLTVAEIWRVIGEIRRACIATLIVDRDDRLVLARSDKALVGAAEGPDGAGRACRASGRRPGPGRLPGGVRQTGGRWPARPAQHPQGCVAVSRQPLYAARDARRPS